MLPNVNLYIEKDVDNKSKYNLAGNLLTVQVQDLRAIHLQ